MESNFKNKMCFQMEDGREMFFDADEIAFWTTYPLVNGEGLEIVFRSGDVRNFEFRTNGNIAKITGAIKRYWGML